MSTLSGFKKDLSKFAKEIEIDLHTLVKQLSMVAFKGIVLKTPVDTGRARINWNVGIRSVDLSVTDTGSGLSKAQATRIALSKMSKFGELKDGYPKVYITNNLPYIKRLEDGWSQAQAPTGMVKVTMAELNQYIRSLK